MSKTKAVSKVVEELPKGQEYGADGIVTLKNGEHNLGDEDKVYRVHGAGLVLKGKVFVARYEVTWLPINECQCKTPRTQPVVIKQHKDEDRWVVRATCNDKECKFNGMDYIWVYPSGTFQTG